MNRFGVWLRAQRDERGWSQVELARFLRCKQSMVARWESGECYPHLPRFRSIVRRLRADANKVLRLVPEHRGSSAA